MNPLLFPGGLRPIWGKHIKNVVVAFVLISLVQPSIGQIVGVGGIARNFTVTDHRTGQPIRLYDYAGKVLVMDFFAYWCGPCQTSSPDLKANVDDYYQSRGGNAHGTPVAVLSVNIESGNPPATDSFIDAFDLNLVADDYLRSAYNQFDTGFIPLFVIINGVSGLASPAQWQVLYRSSGYPGAARIRSIVDTINPSVPVGPASIRNGPDSQFGRVGGAASFSVAADGVPPIIYQWSRNDILISGNTNRLVVSPLALKDRGSYKVTVRNGLGSQTSLPAGLMVYGGGTTKGFVSTNVPKAIPDYPQAGVTSVVNVEDDWEVIRLGVSANITHTYAGDVEVSITSPSGTSATIRPASGNPGTQIAISLTDIPGFLGERSQGTWVLKVTDRGARDVGTLNSWTLGMEHTLDAMNYQEWAAGYPDINLADPASDSDGDTIPNFVEFLVSSFSPDTTDQLPVLEVDPENPQYYQLVIPLRPNVERGLLSVQLAPSLRSTGWTDAVTIGDSIIVDKSVPNTMKVKLKRSLATIFLRMKGVQY